MVLTVSALAERWQCSVDIVYDLLVKGKLHGFKLGRSWRIAIEEVIKFEGGNND